MAKLGDLFPDELLPPAPPPKPQAPENVSRPPAAGNNAPPQNPNFQNRPRPIINPAQQPRPPQPQQQGGKAAPPGMRPAPQVLPGGEVRKMERTFIRDLIAGQEIEGIFLVVDATLRAAKNGSKYIQSTFCDKTGTIPVRHWDATDRDFTCYKINGYIKVRGRVETYKNAMQMIAFTVQECEETGINPSDFLPISVRPLDEMEREFDALLQSFTDPDIKRLLLSIFSDPETRTKYMKGPAATAVHHAWVGGLVEHVLSAAKTAQAIAEQRPFLNRDLLIAGVILHDIGKIEELDGGPGFTYTDTGRLCGHIVLGALLVERHIVKLGDFPKEKRDLIVHLILSHHGELEYGSPVKPYTAEAVALHHLECLDAKVQGIQSIIERERAAGNEGAWTDFARVVDGRIYKGKGSGESGTAQSH
ncbi:MAG TPA: 3'-5' exoribonuclease YhaM family protein [Planctomycetota bacterium]|nr:3'-5' exoribonuclease YhaM family protein [Planctomycetota bacterium]